MKSIVTITLEFSSEDYSPLEFHNIILKKLTEVFPEDSDIIALYVSGSARRGKEQ